MGSFRYLISGIKLFCLLGFFSVLLADLSFGQVSFSTVKNDVLKEYKGVTVIDRGGGRVEVDKSYIPNRRFYYAYVRVSSKDKIEGYNINHHRDVVVNYEFLKGKYVFQSTTKSDSWITGDLKAPTLSEVSGLVQKDLLNFFGSYMINNMTEYNGIKEILAEKYPCFECNNYMWPASGEGKTVYFRVKIPYSYLNGIYLEKREDVFEASLKRDGINKPWISGSLARSSTATKTLEQKELSSQDSDYWKCNTLGIKVRKENAVNEFNKFPKVEIPEFKTAKDMAWWLHKFLRKAKPDEASFVFLSKLQPWYFLECGSYMLNEEGYKLLENIRNLLAMERGNYGDHYCENPNIKEQSGNEKDYQVAFYPKFGSMFSRIRIAEFKGEYKISSITISRYNNKEDIEKLMSTPPSVCKENEAAFWKVYKLDEAGINASFPSEPKKEAYPDKPDKFALIAKHGNVEWYISGEKVKSDLLGLVKDKVKKTNQAKDLSDETRKKFDALAGKEEVWQIRGARGYASTWRAKKEGNITDLKYRSVVFKDYFYEIYVFGNAAPKDVSQFFDSVSIDR